jgi:uncharacterized protein GlcG (DUF336 family)
VTISSHPTRNETRRIFIAWTLASLAFAGAAAAQEGANARRGGPGIRDEAEMFRAPAVAKARRLVEEIDREHRVPVHVDTVDELGGKTIDEVAVQRAEKLGIEGVFVLAARRDHKIEVLVSKPFARLIPEDKRLAIRAAFIDGFKQGNYDEGLERGLLAIEKTLAAEKHAGETASTPPASTPASAPAASASPGGSLVLRNQVRLTLDGARRIIAGAEARASEMGLKMNIAVVDDGGHMLAFERMDGARPASGYTATTKAVTAATFRAPSGPVKSDAGPADPLLNLSLQNAALASGGKLTTLYGGIPVTVDGQVIGGVGVGGGSGEQDAAVARAGVDTLLADLKAAADAPKDKEVAPAGR